MKRLFFALWPQEPALAQCKNLLGELASKGQPVKTDNLHVTLEFLGNVDAERQRALIKAAAQIRFSSIGLIFDQLEFWRKPAVICLTSSKSDPAILDLNRKLTSIAQALEIPVDQRPFRPHITLAKKVKSPAYVKFDPTYWHADTFVLAESVSTPNGVRYKILEHWPSTSKTGDQPCPT